MMSCNYTTLQNTTAHYTTYFTRNKNTQHTTHNTQPTTNNTQQRTGSKDTKELKTTTQENARQHQTVEDKGADLRSPMSKLPREPFHKPSSAENIVDLRSEKGALGEAPDTKETTPLCCDKGIFLKNKMV
jgi:hypothetical protein